MFVTVNRANIFCASAGAIKYKFSVYARAWLIMIVYMELIVRLENKGWRVGLFVQTREVENTRVKEMCLEWDLKFTNCFWSSFSLVGMLAK